MGSVYWFHGKPPCICACLVLCLDLTSLISVNYLSHFVSALCSLALSIIPLAGIDLYKMGMKFDTRSDLTELQAEWQSYIWDTWTTRKEWWASETFCGRNL